MYAHLERPRPVSQPFFGPAEYRLVHIVGDREQKGKFLRELCAHYQPLNVSDQTIIIKAKSEKRYFVIWEPELEYYDQGQYINTNIDECCYEKSDAFICFDNPSNFLNHVENIKKYQVNSFEFNSCNLGPVQFMDKLEESFINYESTCEEKEKAEKQAWEICKGKFDPNSPLSKLPTEITATITEKLYNQYAFFANPLLLVKGALPKPKRSQPKQNVNNSNENQSCILF